VILKINQGTRSRDFGQTILSKCCELCTRMRDMILDTPNETSTRTRDMILDTPNEMSTRTRDLFQDYFRKSNQAIKADIGKT